MRGTIPNNYRNKKPKTVRKLYTLHFKLYHKKIFIINMSRTLYEDEKVSKLYLMTNFI